MPMHEFFEAAVHSAFNMVRGSRHLRIANEGKKMRHRIADERTHCSNISMRVPPCSFLSRLRFTITSLLEEGGMFAFPASIGSHPSSALPFCAHFHETMHEHKQFFPSTGLGVSREPDPSQSRDVNKATLNLRFWPYVKDCGQQPFLPIDHSSIRHRKVFQEGQPTRQGFSLGKHPGYLCRHGSADKRGSPFQTGKPRRACR